MRFAPTTKSTGCALWASAVLLLAACSTTQSNVNEPTADATAEAVDQPGSGTEQQIDAVIASVDQRVATTPTETDLEVGDEITNARTGQIPMELNDDVERWIEYFTVRDRERFQRFIERGEKYRPMITAVLKDQGIPTEIYYQAMIESGFATHAKSHASAVGIWQFIKGTGHRYGLRIDGYVDERRDPMRATIAAAIYMKDLYNVFQSWYLAMAAYNAGEGRIMGAIMRAKTRDFWEMVRGKALPAETMNYIPKFLAATIIGHNPRRYGIESITPEIMPVLTSVTVPSPLKLTDIAKVTGVSIETLKEANPHILRGVTPPGEATYRLWVPKDQAAAFEGNESRLAALRVHGLRNIADTSSPSGRGVTTHQVRRGDTLAGIAGRYGMTLSEIRRLNRMSSNRIMIGTRLKVTGKAVSSRAAAPAPVAKSYKVKRGDNLDVIAKRFGLSVDELKRLNRLKRNTIFVGQTLHVGQQKG